MEERYSNQVLNMDELPRAEDVRFEPLDPALKSAHLTGNSIVIGLLLVINITARFTPYGNEWYSLLILAISLLLLLILLTYPFIAYRYKGMAVREQDILYKEGILFQSIMIIPFNRVQHVEIGQGPIERYFNISSIQIFTAGGSGSDLVISGLQPEQARNIKQFIMKKAVGDEEE